MKLIRLFLILIKSIALIRYITFKWLIASKLLWGLGLSINQRRKRGSNVSSKWMGKRFDWGTQILGKLRNSDSTDAIGALTIPKASRLLTICLSSMTLVRRFSATSIRAIIRLCSLMDRLGLVSPTQSKGTRKRESSSFASKISLKIEENKTMRRASQQLSKWLTFKFTMKNLGIF